MNLIDSSQTAVSTRLNVLYHAAEEASILPGVLWGVVLTYMRDHEQNHFALVHSDIGNALNTNRKFYVLSAKRELEIARSWLLHKITELNTNPEFKMQQTALERILKQSTREIETNEVNYAQTITNFVNIKFKLLKTLNDRSEQQVYWEPGFPPFKDFTVFTNKSHLTRDLSVSEYSSAIHYSSIRTYQDCVDLMNYFLKRDMQAEALQAYLGFDDANALETWLIADEPWVPTDALDLIRGYLPIADSVETEKIYSAIRNIDFDPKKTLIIILTLEALVSQENYTKAFAFIEAISPTQNYLEYLKLPLNGLIQDGRVNEAFERVKNNAILDANSRSTLLELIIAGYVDENNIPKALEIFSSFKFDIIDRVEIVRKIARKYLELGEFKTALKFVETCNENRLCIKSQIQEIEQEFIFIEVEKLIKEQKMEEAQNLYSQTKLANWIPTLEGLANANYNPDGSITISRSNYEMKWDNPLQVVLLPIFLALNATQFINILFPRMKKWNRTLDYSGIKIALNEVGITQTLRFVMLADRDKKKHNFEAFHGSHYRDEMLEKMVHFLVCKGLVDDALDVTKQIIDDAQQVKAYLEIVTLLIKQNNIEQARKIADIIPREGARKLAAKRITEYISSTALVVYNPIHAEQEKNRAMLVKDNYIEAQKKVDDNISIEEAKRCAVKWMDEFLTTKLVQVPPILIPVVQDKNSLTIVFKPPTLSYSNRVKEIEEAQSKENTESFIDNPIFDNVSDKVTPSANKLSPKEPNKNITPLSVEPLEVPKERIREVNVPEPFNPIPTPNPLQKPVIKRFTYIRNACSWIVLKIMSFVAVLFASINSLAISIYTIPSKLIDYRR